MNDIGMKITLSLAALYNLAWGFMVVFFPHLPFQWLHLPQPEPPWIWQCLGMVIGVYGVGYAIAARDPFRHWAIVFVGLLGKICGPLGFLFYAFRGEIPWRFGLNLLFNDLVWWIPFTLILTRVYRQESLRKQIW